MRVLNSRLCRLLIICITGFHAVFNPYLALADEEKASEALGYIDRFYKTLSGDFGSALQGLESLGVIIIAIVVGIGAGWRFLRRKDTDSRGNNETKLSSLQEVEDNYYANLNEQCQRYDLGSFRDSQTASEQTAIHVKLADIYVDLMAHKVAPEKSKLATENKHNQEEKIRQSKLLLEHFAEKGRGHIVIRGDVGSGKSSFINYLTHSVVESRTVGGVSSKVPDQWLRRPVVRLLLREIGGEICHQKNLEEQLFGFIKQRTFTHIRNRATTEDSSLETFWEHFRKDIMNNGILILDGLDEVSDSDEKPEEMSRRQILLAAIQQFARNPDHQGMSIIITSRNHAYGGDDELPDFQLLQLDPLNTSDRYRVFVRHWYEKVAYTDEEKVNNQKDAQRLLDNISRRPSLQVLTATPLLLTLILVLDKEKIGLPESRAELYQNAVNLLLDRWNKQLIPHGSSLSKEEQQALEVLDIDPNILFEALKSLAYDTYTEAESEVKNSDQSIIFRLETVLHALLGQLEQYPQLGITHQRSCHDFLRFRSQLLVASGDSISFVHKSFHEYLAAAYVMDLDMSRDEQLWEMAATKEKRDWWQEVFLFALNIGKAEYVMKLLKMQALSRQLTSLDNEALDNHIGSLSLFSVAALENSLEKKVSINAKRNRYLRDGFDDLQKHMQLLWDDKRLDVAQKARVGRVLGRFGDIRDGMTFKRDGYVIQYHSGNNRTFPIPDFKWIKIAPGSFTMGTEGEEGYSDEKPPHSMSYDEVLYMSHCAVTNAQYQAFVDAGGYDDEALWQALPKAAQQWRDGKNQGLELLETWPENSREDYRNWLVNDRVRNQPRFWQDNDENILNHPVVGVSWFEALAYCEWLNQNKTLILPDNMRDNTFQFRLPTEDEWEYAARGSVNNIYACGELTPDLANYEETGLKRTTTAGVFAEDKVNGLYDMTGNVWEWTSSRWGNNANECDFVYGEDYISQKSVQNRLDDMEYRIIRGGSWNGNTDLVRCAVRGGNLPDGRGNYSGFRVVLSV